MNVSDRLADLYTIRQLLLQRLAAGEQAKLNRQFDDIAADIERQLKSGKPLTDYQGRRLDGAIRDLAQMVNIKPPELGDLGRLEAEFAQGAFIAVGIDAKLPPASVINSIADSTLVQGSPMSAWFDKLNENLKFDLTREAKLGVSLGETNAQIAKRIIGAGGDKGPELMPRGRRDAMAITRTSIQTIAKDARLATMEANADIIKAVQWVSTLDGRTSDICIARSGLTWSFPDYKPIGHKIPWLGGPPAHWQCRSTVIPVTKTFRELGIDQDEIAPSTRASMDGQVAANMTFDQFLKSKPSQFADEMLGKGRAELWREGKITLTDLLNPRGVPLTLQQLEAKYGTATATAAAAAATETAIAANEIDSLIEAVKNFEYSEEYVAAQSEMQTLSNTYNELLSQAEQIGIMNISPEFRDAIIRVKVNFQNARSAFNDIYAVENKRAVSLLHIPNERRMTASSMISGTVPVPVRDSVAEATQIIAALIDARFAPRVNVALTMKSRAFYVNNGRSININSKTSISTVVHEIMHDLEYQYPEISQKTKAFLQMRSGGEAPKKLSKITGIKSYKANEIAYEDQWVARGGDAYMGKIYDNRPSTELVTMGMERLIADPKAFAMQDPEYFRLMLEILRGVV